MLVSATSTATFRPTSGSTARCLPRSRRSTWGRTRGPSSSSSPPSGTILKAGGDHTSSGAFEDGTGITPTLGGSRPHAVATHTEVRRLTPRECERLQGHPDDWTAGQSDSQRYKQLGNGVAVPVFEWVAARLIAQHEQIVGAA